MATPWLTSDDLIESVKRKFSIPISQNTFEESDILLFANEEMSIAQVPSIMLYHEEYFVTTKTVALEANKSRYEIPERAIGGKLRDLFYQDSSGNLYEMTRISPDDKSFFQDSSSGNQVLHKFYLQGNDVVLTPSITDSPTGSLVFSYFLRPNQLVANSRAAIITYFSKNITVSNSTLTAGDTITINGEVFTARASGAGADEFNIGGTAIITATNLVAAINTNGVCIATNGTPASASVVLKFTTLSPSQTPETDNSVAFTISSQQQIEFSSVPSHIVAGSVIDFLQTRSGHRMRAMDISIPTGGVSVNQISFTESDVPTDLVVGDYICAINECIIPQIPTDLHNALAERTGARILASMGDQAGLTAANAKIAENEQRQSSLLDNRVTGAAQKITNKRSLLRSSTRRRY